MIVLLYVSSVEDIHTSMAQVSSSQTEQGATPHPPTTETTTTTQGQLSTVLLDSMSTSIWASTISTVPNSSGPPNPLHVHQVIIIIIFTVFPTELC